MSRTPHDGSQERPLDLFENDDLDEPISWPMIGRRLKSVFWQGLALLGVCLLVASVGTATAGWYTSRSQFCNSCHIMEPYYESWQESSHKDVACTKCHFPPGVAEKVRGKVLGLVQLAKYLTSTQGPRPAAEIPDASCLRSGCHETRLLSGRVDFDGIPFDHAKHLGKLRRGKQLRCTSCHSQIVQGAHMTVTKSTCFLCHFKDGYFNEGLGACTRCHQIPEAKYDLGGGVMFHHDLAYEQGVDCASCHSDLIRGNGEVPRERCTVCHNRPDDLERIGDVAFMHQMHVTDHKVDCMSCHLELRHSLDSDEVVHAAQQCSVCHPKQHDAQVAMLKGTGAKLIPPHPSNMLAARLSCFTCHDNEVVSEAGNVLMKASMKTCVGCHAAEEIDQLQQYHSALRSVLAEFDTELKRVGAALESAKLLPLDRLQYQQRFDNLQHDVDFMHAGNDIHNSHYASELADKLLAELTRLCESLQLAAPSLQLPEKPKRQVGETLPEAGSPPETENQPEVKSPPETENQPEVKSPPETESKE